MKRFACGDVVPDCQASWVCPTEDEILVNVEAHARTAHGVDPVSPELVAAVRARITDQ